MKSNEIEKLPLKSQPKANECGSFIGEIALVVTAFGINVCCDHAREYSNWYAFILETVSTLSANNKFL